MSFDFVKLAQLLIENTAKELEESFVKCIWPADNWDNESYHSNNQQSWIVYFKSALKLQSGLFDMRPVLLSGQFILTKENAEFESYSFAFFATISFVITRIATICTNCDIVNDIDDNCESDLKLYLSWIGWPSQAPNLIGQGRHLVRNGKYTHLISYQENETKGHSNTDFENCQKNLLAKKFSRNIHDNNSNQTFYGDSRTT